MDTTLTFGAMMINVVNVNLELPARNEPRMVQVGKDLPPVLDPRRPRCHDGIAETISQNGHI